MFGHPELVLSSGDDYNGRIYNLSACDINYKHYIHLITNERNCNENYNSTKIDILKLPND